MQDRAVVQDRTVMEDRADMKDRSVVLNRAVMQESSNHYTLFMIEETYYR